MNPVGPVRASCTSSTCVVTGEASFLAQDASRNARSMGTTAYTFELLMGPGGPRIGRQSAKVVRQTLAPLVRGETLALRLQRALGRLGCGPDSADGIWGTGFQRALERFNRTNRAQIEAAVPTQVALDAVSRRSARRCR